MLLHSFCFCLQIIAWLCSSYVPRICCLGKKESSHEFNKQWWRLKSDPCFLLQTPASGCRWLSGNEALRNSVINFTSRLLAQGFIYLFKNLLHLSLLLQRCFRILWSLKAFRRTDNNKWGINEPSTFLLLLLGFCFCFGFFEIGSLCIA